MVDRRTVITLVLCSAAVLGFFWWDSTPTESTRDSEAEVSDLKGSVPKTGGERHADTESRVALSTDSADEKSLTVQVVDVRGDPAAGVEVVVGLPRQDGGPVWDNGDYGETKKTSGPMALARFRLPRLEEPTEHDELDELLSIASPSNRLRRARMIAVQARSAHGKSSTVAVDRHRWSEIAQPIRLKLPAAAWIRVKVTDAAGNLIPRPHVQLFHDLQNADGSPAGSAGHRMLPEFFVGADPRGQYRIAVLADGRQWRAQASIGGYAFSTQVVAPDQDGAEATALVTIPADVPFLQGVASTSSGRPLADARLAVEVSRSAAIGAGAVKRERAKAIADERGRFWVVLGEADGILEAVTVRVVSLAGDQTGAEGRAVVEQRIVTGGIDIGTVVLRPTPLVCAGRMFLDGKPKALSPYLFVVMTQLGESGSSIGWQPVTGTRFLGDETGRFQIRGAAPDGRLRLVWGGEWGIPLDHLAFTRGSRDLRVEMRSGGTMQTVLLLPPVAVDPANLKLSMVGVDATGAAREIELEGTSSWASNPKATVARFSYPNIVAGEFTLTVRLKNETEPVLRIPGVVIRDGETVEDRRLRMVDLRGHVHATTLEIVDERGRGQRDTRASWLCRKAEGWMLLVRSSRRLVFLHRARNVDLSVVTRGRPPLRVQATGGKQKVVLPEAVVQTLRFRHSLHLPTGVTAWVEVASSQGSVARPDVGRLVDPQSLATPIAVKRCFDTNREAVVAWPRASPFESRLFLARGARRTSCVARIERRDGLVVFTVADADRRRALGDL